MGRWVEWWKLSQLLPFKICWLGHKKGNSELTLHYGVTQPHGRTGDKTQCYDRCSHQIQIAKLLPRAIEWNWILSLSSKMPFPGRTFTPRWGGGVGLPISPPFPCRLRPSSNRAEQIVVVSCSLCSFTSRDHDG